MTTPHGAQTFQMTAGYWPNGLLNSFSTNLSGVPGLTVTPDGEGRTLTITANSGQNPVTGTTYNTAGQVTGVTLGSGDSDTFGFDTNTARPASYNASVNGVSKATIITNNTNRTIRQVAVTDGLFSGGSQTCTSGYDDLGRLGYSNCLPLWFASYSYDPFGNIDKSDQGYSGTSFLPTYNQATNRFQALPAPPQPTYDGNGNLTYDGFHNYTWDAEGNMLTIDGSASSTFDAFNRRVEYGSGSTYTQLLYPPFDETYQLGTWGATPSVRMPLPGGGQAIFNSSGLNNYRHPNWQGSQTLASSPTRTMLVDNAFTPFGEKYAEYNGGYNGYFADMLAIGPNGLIADGYQSETRMLHGSQGRWVSPDPAGLGAVDPTNPQTWNRYAYVGNDPLNHVDPSGMDAQSGTICITTPVTMLGGNGINFQLSTNCSVYAAPPSQSVTNSGPENLGVGAGGSATGSGTLGLTNRQACYADAIVNGALGFVPGYNATKTVASLVGFSFNPVQFINGNTGPTTGFNSSATPFAAGTLTGPQVVAAITSAGSLGADANYAAAGGAAALNRAGGLISRAGFASQTLSRQGRLLQQAAYLERLASVASAAKNLGTVFSLASTAVDLYLCSKTQ